MERESTLAGTLTLTLTLTLSLTLTLTLTLRGGRYGDPSKAMPGFGKRSKPPLSAPQALKKGQGGAPAVRERVPMAF